MKEVLKRLFQPYDEEVETSESIQELDIEVQEDGNEKKVNVGQIAVDVFEVSEWLIVIAPLAGVTQSDLDVNLVKNVLTLSGHRKKPDIYEEIEEMHVSECFYGEFSRSVILPENLGLNHIRATIERWMLIVTIPHLVVDSKNIKVENIEDIN